MVSPKWQKMWVESQHCSKSVVNMPLPSQQAKKILEDLKSSCCSPNKAVQAEALKCWGLWIHNQNPDDWKLNIICFSAVRPLITKKLQPLHKDVDICKLRLSLMWALLVKVQEIMQLEGPQYILEVFLQSCLTWLSSTDGHGNENEINFLIFQLLLAVFNKNEILTDCDKEMFPPLSTDVLQMKKVFHRLADKFLNIFIYWRKVDDRSVVLKIWKHFLEHCELSNEHIPVPVWRKVFKIAGQICSEKDSPIKERLAFLHSCATTLKSALSSSQFIDFGNLLTTPCEVLLKKLTELCTVECNELCDSDMFLHSKEICQVLLEKSVAISGYDLCINVLDILEEFCLRSLFWGVWCGLVYCYKTLFKDLNKNQLTRTETKFYRKLRGVAVNFELDKSSLHEDCVKEVEKHIGFLNISCMCLLHSVEITKAKMNEKKPEVVKPQGDFGISKEIVPVLSKHSFGKLSMVPFPARTNLKCRKFVNLNFDLLKDILSTLNLDLTKTLLNSMLTFRFIRTQTAPGTEMVPRNISLQLKNKGDTKKKVSLTVSCQETTLPPSPKRLCTPVKRNAAALYEEGQTSDEVLISTPKTRSRKRAEEERKKELEIQKRRKRKSFEVLVQEIVRKNKERKTEKNIRKKSPEAVKGKGRKKRVERQQGKANQKTHNLSKDEKQLEVSFLKLRNRKKKEPQKTQRKREKNSRKTDGKLENYFKVIPKKSENNAKEMKKPSKAKKGKRKKSEKRCGNFEKEEKERKGEIGWKQTSLKTMINPKSKMEKVKQGMQTRYKTREVTEDKSKPRDEGKKVLKLNSPLAKLSPYKEVLHDHEYAKVYPENLETFQKVFIPNKEKSKSKEKSGMPEFESSSLVTEKIDFLQIKEIAEKKTLTVDKPEMHDGGNINNKVSTTLKQNFTELESEKLKLKERNVSKFSLPMKDILPEEGKTEESVGFDTEMMDFSIRENLFDSGEESEKPKQELLHCEENYETQSVCRDRSGEEFSKKNSTSDEKARKRIRMLDNLKPRKKLKLEEEETDDLIDEKLPLEITEKENLEEKQPESVLISPDKKERAGGLTLKNNGSPKAINGGMSRALRIIGLVPESTMGRSWDSSPRVEALKCKKAPNVDKNSRASKMLALLSENIMEAEEIVKTSDEEINGSVVVATTFKAKTPLSSLKSPKSVKKRRSIRFDDARNETIVYQVDTPPSQILEEKEKGKGMRPFELALHLP